MKPVLAIIIEMMIITYILVLSGCSLSPGPGKEASKSASVGPVNNAPESHTGTEFNIGTPATYGTPLFTTRNSSDPHSSIFNGVLYLYTSSDMGITGSYPMSTTYCYSTSDLINWTDNGAMINENSLPWAYHNTNQLWAPDCVYANGQYYLYTPDDAADATGNDIGKRIGVSISTSPTGPFIPQNDYIHIPTVAGAPQGDFASDPDVFIDTNGTPYMLYCDGNAPKGRVCIIKLDPSMTKTAANATPVLIESLGNGTFPNQFEEGARLSLINGIYYLYYPVSIGSREFIVYAMARNVMGPYTYHDKFMSANQTEWTVQGDIANYDNKWILFYHDTPMVSQGYKRMVCGEYFTFNSDGTIPTISRTVEGLTVNPNNQIQAATYFSQSGGLQTEPTSDPGSSLDVRMDSKWKLLLL